MFLSEMEKVRHIRFLEMQTKNQVNEISKIVNYDIEKIEELALRIYATTIMFRKEVENNDR